MKSYSIPLSLAGAALALVGGLAYFLNPAAGYAPVVNVVVGLGLLVVAGIFNPNLFRHYARWLNAFWGTIMVLGIVVMVNFLADRYPRRLDLTEGQLHSLSELTVQTLKGLDRDVRVLAFMEGGGDARLETLLKGYSIHSGRFRYEFIDPDSDPERARQYLIQHYNTLVIEAGDRQQKTTELQERQITNALLKVLRDRREVVYFTVGHGEAGLGEAPEALGLLQQRLEEIDYVVQDSLFLAREGEVPEDCAVLIVAGPRTPLLANEVEAVRRYLDRGGALLALLDPLFASGLENLLAEWGVHVGDDFVIDTSGIGTLFGLDFTTPVAVRYGTHPITDKHQGLMTFYQLARSVQFEAGGRETLEGVELVETSDQGWADRDLSVLQAKGQRTVSFDPEVDRPGPISLAVAVNRKVADDLPGARLVVFGNSNFATNRFFNYQGNGDLALNAVSWLVEDESLISIRPREAGYNPIALTDSQARWVFWITVVVIPVLVALTGLSIVSRKGRWSLADLAAAGLSIALSLAMVGLLNFIADRYHYRIDLTEDKLFTLSGQTEQLLGSLAQQNQLVQVKTFMGDMEGRRFQELLKEYKYRSRYFDYEILDPQKNALLVSQYGIRERGTSIVEVASGGQVRSERIVEQTEEALSNAIRRALRAQDRKIYFTGGQGEGDLNQMDGEGFSILKGRLTEMNFEVLDGLEVSQGVPEDAAILAILSPEQRIVPESAEAIRHYLRRGGSALLLLDPGGETGLEELLGEYSIELGQDFVVDLSGMGQLFGADVSVPVVLNYGDHPAVARIAQGMMSFFPLARSVFPAADRRPGIVELESLLLTHPSSWAETDLSPLLGVERQVEFDPEVDRPGPISLAVAVEAQADTSLSPGQRTRLVVFGDADFANNQYFGQQANGELLVGSIDWLSEEEDRLTIASREPRFNPINLVGHEGSVILWISVFILPFAIALSGLVMVLKRGYDTYAAGFISWLLYTFLGNAVFFLVTAVIRLSEGSWLTGEGYLIAAMLCAVVSYGLYRRVRWVWELSLGLSVLCALAGLWIIPNDTIQLLYAALFVVNAAILVWIRKAFAQ